MLPATQLPLWSHQLLPGISPGPGCRTPKAREVGETVGAEMSGPQPAVGKGCPVVFLVQHPHIPTDYEHGVSLRTPDHSRHLWGHPVLCLGLSRLCCQGFPGEVAEKGPMGVVGSGWEEQNRKIPVLPRPQAMAAVKWVM